MDERLADTLKPPKDDPQAADSPQGKTPGLVQIWMAGKPVFRTLPLIDGQLDVGREHETMRADPDLRMSRRHARVTHDGRRFQVEDLGSSNGTAVDGEILRRGSPREIGRFVRMGDSFFMPVPDIEFFAAHQVTQQGEFIRGPTMAAVLSAAARAAQFGDTLLILGESGSGKEGVARAFHAAGPGASDRFVAVNCATIPEGIAERLLFGAKRGSYSGADADADGYLQAADGGTLFLDEIGDLDPIVQAKLLRVLENKEILPVGATRPKPIKLRVCSATHKDLRAQVGEGGMREDLFFRLAQSQINLPPLRERLEELPWLLRAAIDRVDPQLKMGVSFVESALLRVWPGNVRELLAETRNAAQAALTSSARQLEVQHLRDSAGSALKLMDQRPVRKAGVQPDRQTIETTLSNTGGNVKETARLLKLHRNQLYRLLDRYGIEVKRPAGEG